MTERAVLIRKRNKHLEVAVIDDTIEVQKVPLSYDLNQLKELF